MIFQSDKLLKIILCYCLIKRENTLKLLKKTLVIFVVVLIVIGVKFWNKSSSYHDVKAQMLEFCRGTTQCEATLSENFDTCFNSHYDMGSKRRSGGLDQSAFVQCINKHAGSELLTLHQ
jgi:hypothetical protein